MKYHINCRGNFDDRAFSLAKKLHAGGASLRYVGDFMNVSHTTVRNALARGLRPSKRARRQPPPLPRARLNQIKRRRELVRQFLAMRVVRFGVRVQLYNSPARISAALREHGFTGPSTKHTVRRDMLAMGFAAKKRPKGPERKLHDPPRRLEFAKAHRNLDGLDGLFSDEKWYDGNDHVGFFEWCEADEWPSPQMTGQSGQGGGIPKLHVWGLIGKGVKKLFFIPKGRTVDADYYQTILEKHKAVLKQPGRFFVQDGAPAHRSRSTMSWLGKNRVNVLWPWPARSPDLNPIEVMWRLVEERCGRAAAQTADELQQAVIKAWNDVPQETVDKLCASFTECLHECIRAEGGLVLRNRIRASRGRQR